MLQVFFDAHFPYTICTTWNSLPITVCPVDRKISFKYASGEPLSEFFLPTPSVPIQRWTSGEELYSNNSNFFILCPTSSSRGGSLTLFLYTSLCGEEVKENDIPAFVKYRDVDIHLLLFRIYCLVIYRWKHG